MIKELESLPQFKARISKNEQDIAQGLPSFSEPGWLLANHRDRGSIHSDIWTGPAIDLAARSHIAVYPVAGWWKERLTADRFNAEMRYTLIISIHTPNADVDIYTPVSLEVSAEVAITT